MNILGIDTSTKFLCIGFYDGSKIYEYRLNLGRGHDVLLVPSVRRILACLNKRASDIDCFAAGLGPGSFTGIRIGLSAVKGFVVSLNKKVIGISSLDIIAYNAKEEDSEFICPLIDARRGLIYTSLYRRQAGLIQRIMPYKLIEPKLLKRIIPRKTVFLGDALSIYKKDLAAGIKGAMFLDEDFFYPKATNIIRIAIERARLKQFDSVRKLKAIYLYPKECQVRNSKFKVQNSMVRLRSPLTLSKVEVSK